MTKASDNIFPRLLISEGGSTATPGTDEVTVYAKSDGLLYSKDDGGTETPLGGGGIADEGAFTYLDATDAAAPGNPSSGYHRIYSKTGGLYYRDNAGTEVGPLGAGGGGSSFYANSIPHMTSATAPSGVASDSEHYSSLEAWRAMALPGLNSGWLSAGSALPQWIGYQYSAAKIAVAYGFRPWFVDNYPDRTPTAWEFQGSNDGFSTYDVLDSVSGWAPTSSVPDFVWAVASPASYDSYRLVVSANGGNSYVGIGEFLIFTSETAATGVIVVTNSGYASAAR